MQYSLFSLMNKWATALKVLIDLLIDCLHGTSALIIGNIMENKCVFYPMQKNCVCHL